MGTFAKPFLISASADIAFELGLFTCDVVLKVFYEQLALSLAIPQHQ